LELAERSLARTELEAVNDVDDHGPLVWRMERGDVGNTCRAPRSMHAV